MKILYGQDLVNELNRYCLEIKERLWIAVPYIGAKKAVTSILGERCFNDSSLSVKLLTDVSDTTCIDYNTLSLFIDKGYVKTLLGLHAKVYIVDNRCIVTSANLTQTAFTKRYEMGLSFDVNENPEIADVFDEWWGLGTEIQHIDDIDWTKNINGQSREESGDRVNLPTLFQLPFNGNNILGENNNNWERLFQNKSEEIILLYEFLDERIRGIDTRINRHVTGANIMYSTTLNFLELSPRVSGFNFLLRTRNGQIDDPLQLTSRVDRSFNWGHLTHRFRIRVPVSKDVLDATMALINQAFIASI